MLWEYKPPKFSITDQCFELQLEMPEEAMILLPLYPGFCTILVNWWRCCPCSGTSAAETVLAFCSARCMLQDLSLCSGTCTREAMDLGLYLLRWRKDGVVKLVGGPGRCIQFRSLH